jgi:hypothetical protein
MLAAEGRYSPSEGMWLSDYYLCKRISETSEVQKWRKTKEDGAEGCEGSTCFTARDATEKYQSQIHPPLEHQEPAVTNVTFF